MKFIFDVYNTLLFPPNRGIALEHLHELENIVGVELNDVCREWMCEGWTLAPLAYIAGSDFDAVRDHCLVTSYRSVEEFSKTMLPDFNERNLICRFIEMYHLFFESQLTFPARKQFEMLVARGFEIHLLSNANFLQQASIQKIFGEYGGCKKWISCELGTRKPSLRLLETVCGSERDFLYIGDSLTSDIEPAQSFGLKTEHVRGPADTLAVLSRMIQ